MDKIVYKMLKSGKIGIIPTDTIYGIVGSAFSLKAIEHIYKLKKRNPKKPFIILIGKIADLKLFGIKINPQISKAIKKLWPGPVSVLFPCEEKKFNHLHRGTEKIAFRLPKDDKLRNLLRHTGPLVAPSANPEGKKPAENLSQAQKYFGSSVDFYVDGGTIRSQASALISVAEGKIIILRKGAKNINI